MSGLIASLDWRLLCASAAAEASCRHHGYKASVTRPPRTTPCPLIGRDGWPDHHAPHIVRDHRRQAPVCQRCLPQCQANGGPLASPWNVSARYHQIQSLSAGLMTWEHESNRIINLRRPSNSFVHQLFICVFSKIYTYRANTFLAKGV